MALTKIERRIRIKRRIRKIVEGSAERPRLCVFRSNKQIYAQLVNDATQTTLFGVSSLNKEMMGKKMTKIEQAAMVGTMVGNKAKEAGIETVVFDRNGYLYHGRVKALADAARAAGLKF